MVIIKAMLSGLTGCSLCLADISGTVTDASGAMPLSGAIVRLEKSGLTATAGADGSFTLVISSAVLPVVDNRFTKSKPGAALRKGMVYVNVVEKSEVTISVFDLNGRFCSSVRKTMDAGMHCAALPQQGTGVRLYKIQSGKNVLVLKAHAFDGASSLQGSLSYSNAVAKQAKAAAAIHDVIIVTKSGYLNYGMIVENSDTTGIAIKMIASAGTMTDADGNEYQTVKIGNQEWTTENLRTTKYRDGTAIPFDTSTETWANDTGPKFCYYGNTTNADSIKKFGALYNWYVVDTANVKKIAPFGWHVPTDAEWDTLQSYLAANGYNWDGTTTDNKMAKSLASKTDWDTSSSQGAIGNDLTKNNTSGFSALPGGERNYNGVFCNIGGYGYWLSATKIDALSAFSRDLSSDWGHMYKDYGNQGCGFSLRLVRDN